MDLSVLRNVRREWDLETSETFIKILDTVLEER
jgi:hypothetical protein